MDKYLNTIFGNLRALEEIRRARVSRKCENSWQISNSQRLEPVCTKLMREAIPKKICHWRSLWNALQKWKPTKVPGGLEQQLLVRRGSLIIWEGHKQILISNTGIDKDFT